MRLINRANISPEKLALIECELPEQHNLQDVVKWGLADQTGLFVHGVVAEVVVQDEFTHDVVVPWRDGLVLTYDTT